MKKTELLKIKPLTVTEQMRQSVHQDKGTKIHTCYTWGRKKDYTEYEHYLYFSTIEQNGILKVAVFTRKRIAAGETEPKYEIFLSKQENDFITYQRASASWLTAKIDMLELMEEEGYRTGNKTGATPYDNQAVNQFLGSEKEEIYQAVLNFQYEIRKEKLKKKHRRETDEIDEWMNKVPELPKDFEQWVKSYGLYHSRYIFYLAGKNVKEGYCSHCGKTVAIKNPRRNQEGFCPKCKSKIIYKPWNGQKYIVDDSQVGILQQLKDGSGLVVRMFSTGFRYTKEKEWKNPEFRLYEHTREILTQNYRTANTYIYGEYKQSGYSRWCNNYSGYYGYHYYYQMPSNRILYHKNLKDIRMEDSRIKYIPLEEIPKHLPGTNFNAGEFLYFATQRPWVEYLIKAKCYKLAVACLKENTIDIQKGAKRPWELLNITKEQFLLCAQIDANKKEWGAIQQANKYNLTITKQQIQWIDKYGELDMISAAKNTTLHKFIRYLKEQLHVESDKEAWKDYDDYLNMSGQCRYDMSREDILYPQNFKQAHDSRSEELEAIKEKRAKATEKTNDRAYKKMLPQMNELYQYEDQNYTIVIPTCKADFRKEGNENHNCVATYFDRVLDKTCTILFLREKSNPEKSFCTVEMKEDVLVQCRSHHNGKTTKEVDCFIEKYCKEIKKRLAKKEGKAS